jgi:cbb3-type cytochrome oxidase cytochrome c subunit
MSRSALAECRCGSGQRAPARFDGYRIFLTYACDKCWPQKLKTFRADIMQRYDTDEPIEQDDARG